MYALHAFFVALIFYLIGDPALAKYRQRKVFLMGLVLGLALGNHVSMLLLIPGVIVAAAFSGGRWPRARENSCAEAMHFEWRDLVCIWTAVSVSVFAVSYCVVDWYVHLIPLSLVLAIWIGFGFAEITTLVSSHGRIFGYIFGVLCAH